MIDFVTRQEWGARQPKEAPIKISVPTPIVYVHHVGGDMTMREIQDLHMDKRGWNDIAYNFVVFESGIVNIGRGFGIKGGHVLDPENRICHGICLNGNFQTGTPTTAALRSLTELLWMGWKQGYWLLDIRGHRDTMSTKCPGDNLYRLLPNIENSACNWTTVTPRPPTAKEILMDQAINFYVKNTTGAVLFVMRTTDPHRPVAAMGVTGPFKPPAGAVMWEVQPDDFSFFNRYRIDTEPEVQ